MPSSLGSHQSRDFSVPSYWRPIRSFALRSLASLLTSSSLPQLVPFSLSQAHPFLVSEACFCLCLGHSFSRSPRPVLSNYLCPRRKVTSPEWASLMTLSKSPAWLPPQRAPLTQSIPASCLISFMAPLRSLLVWCVCFWVVCLPFLLECKSYESLSCFLLMSPSIAESLADGGFSITICPNECMNALLIRRKRARLQNLAHERHL